MTDLHKVTAGCRRRPSFGRLLLIALAGSVLALAAGCNLSDYLGGGSSSPATVSIESLTATPSQIAENGGVVTLNAKLEGVATSYAWKQVSGPAATLTRARRRKPGST